MSGSSFVIPAIAGMTLLLLCGLCAASEQSASITPTQPAPALPAPKAPENRLLDIALAADTLVAVGQQGVILTSADGKTWRQSASPTGAMLTRVRFTDEKHGWALGYDATILHTADGGASWTLRHHDPEARALYDLLFLDAQHGLAVGAYGTLLETRDGGANWSARDDALAALGMHLNAILRLGDGSLFVVGERGLMARSADQGGTWTLLDSPYAGSLFGALPQGDRGVLVYGMRGHVFLSADPAQSPTLDPDTWDPYSRESLTDPAEIARRGWAKLDSPVAESLFGAAALPGGNGAVLVGVNGTTLRFDPRSRTLAAMPVPAAETLSKLVVHDQRLIAVGRRGIIDLGKAP